MRSSRPAIETDRLHGLCEQPFDDGAPDEAVTPCNEYGHLDSWGRLTSEEKVAAQRSVYLSRSKVEA